jgi:hypothetical protein
MLREHMLLFSSHIVLGTLEILPIGKHEGQRPFGRPRLRWESSIKMVVK